MSADRQVPTTGTGAAAWADHNVEIGKLYDISCMTLVINSGLSTADAIVADPEVPLTGSLVDGMKFKIRPTADNTISGLTIKIPTGGTTFNVVDRDGNALAAGQWKGGRDHEVRYDLASGKLRIEDNIEPTPVAAVAQPAFRNIMGANGGFEVWQRGAGDSASIAVAASTTAYTADRWYLTTGANQACTASAQSPGVDRSRLVGRFARNNGQTGTGALILSYPLTTEECIRMRGKKIALQFSAQAGANFSPTSGLVTYNVYFGTGSEGKRGAGFTSESNPISGSLNLTPGGSIGSVSTLSGSAVGSTVTQGEVRITWTPTGTAGVNDYVQFDNFQLESNDTAATPFEILPFEIMLDLCLRHYAKTFAYGTAPAQNAGVVNALSGEKDLGLLAAAASFSTNKMGTQVCWNFPRRMRTTPTVTTYNPSAANANWRFITDTIDAARTINPKSTTGDSRVTIVGSAQTSGVASVGDGDQNPYIHATADASL